MRLLLVGAFPYPHHQGSQVYFQEQAIALRAAGAEVDLLTYASAAEVGIDPDRWRALDGFVHLKTPAWITPTSLRSGPTWGKPIADWALSMTLNDAIASKNSAPGSYDAILTHNAEATLIATAGSKKRPGGLPPVIYCVHTLMQNELYTYSNSLNIKHYSVNPNVETAPGHNLRRATRRVIEGFGRRIDRRLAQRADGWVALTRSAARVIRSDSNAPGALVPPPLPDPRHRLDALDPERAARRMGLEPDRFYLYSGNLDGYQELEILSGAADLLGARGEPSGPIVLASHDPRVLERFGAHPNIEARVVGSELEMQALIEAARASLIMRQAEGGFPIKLANSLAAGTPPIVFLEREWGLQDQQNALVISRNLPARSLVAGIDLLEQNPDLAERLGAGARALYERNHLPAQAAAATLALIEAVLSRPR
jgi:glycosyltransferase involved in cell wall biosynthesis